jgi:hypothetical protein
LENGAFGNDESLAELGFEFQDRDRSEAICKVESAMSFFKADVLTGDVTGDSSELWSSKPHGEVLGWRTRER